MSGPTSAVPAETDVQNCFVGFRASASGESDIHGWYEKRVAEGTVPYEVVRPSVTLITRYSVIANGNEMRLAARTTRLLTSALPASSPRSKLVAPSQPFGSRSVVPSSSRTRPTTRSALFCARMGGGFCSDGCGDGRETVMTTARNMGELAGFAIPRLGMGTMALAIEGRPDRDTAIRTIHAGLDAGVRYLDTAWSYYLPSQPGTGTAEDLGYGEKMVRDALASWDGPRDEVLIATKTGYRRTMEAPNVAENEPERQHLQAVGSQYGWMADSRPETMICDAKESAAHLGVEALDLLYSHGPDPEVAYEDQVGALKQLLDEGVIRYAGISRVDNAQIDIAREILGDKLIAVQNQFSPSHPDPEHTMEHCAELGLAFVCWSPLGGFLDAFDQRAYDPFRTVAGNHGCSYQRVVLAWELSRYERLFTIPSARNPQEINDSFAATELTLTQDELAMLNASVDARRG